MASPPGLAGGIIARETDSRMTGPPLDPPSARGRRLQLARRQGERRREADRRRTERRQVDRLERSPRWIGQESVLILVDVEYRGGADRRHGAERRASRDRRGGVERRGQSVGEHVRSAVQLIGHVAQSGDLDDEFRRGLDGALFRLRFALGRLESGESP